MIEKNDSLQISPMQLKHLKGACKWKGMYFVAVSTSRFFRRILAKVAPSLVLIKFVATDGEKVIGTSTLHIEPDKKSYIGHIRVDEAYRDRGIGTALVRRMIGATMADGICKIELSTDENNQRAIHVYEKCGFRITDRSIQMELDLPSGGRRG